MKLTSDEARLLKLAVELRMRVLAQYAVHPVISTCLDGDDKAKLADQCEAYAPILRKLDLSIKASASGTAKYADIAKNVEG